MQNEDKKVKRSFFKNMNSELKKVIWPTGKQTVKSTFITISFVLIISLILIIFNVLFDFLSTSWYDLITPDNEQFNQIVVSGDVSGEVSGDVSGELLDETQTGVSGDVLPDTNNVEDTSIVE